MSFYQQSTISLYSWFLLVLSCNIFLMTFHGSIFLSIKLGPTMTSSPRWRGRGLHNLDSSHDQIRCFWLAEVRNFTNIMIEYGLLPQVVKPYHLCAITIKDNCTYDSALDPLIHHSVFQDLHWGWWYSWKWFSVQIASVCRLHGICTGMWW